VQFTYWYTGEGRKRTASLTLTVFAVAYTSHGWLIVDTVADGAAEAFSGE
jgi:hypothetical protein